MNTLILKIRGLVNYLLRMIIQYPRIVLYKLLSNCPNVMGKLKYNQPALIIGKGKVVFEGNVNIGVYPSPMYFSSYAHIEARKSNSTIIFGDGCWINNNFCAISEGEGIFIGEKALIGSDVRIFDSDFHELSPDKRTGGTPKTAKVKIGNNVFIGSDVTILKGVVIGDNTVIANGSIVVKSIPSNVICGGVPAKVLKSL